MVNPVTKNYETACGRSSKDAIDLGLVLLRHGHRNIMVRKIDSLSVGYLRCVVHIMFVLEEKGGGFDVVFLGSYV